MRSEVTLIDLDFSCPDGPSLLTLAGLAFAEAEVDVVDRADRNARKPGAVTSGQVQGKETKNLTENRGIQL